MCGITGIKQLDQTKRDTRSLVSELLLNVERRGREATGVATVRNGKLDITKDNKPASAFVFDNRFTDFQLGDVVTGHTRLSTSATPAKNKNNHPFKADGFVLTHNGHISNHQTLIRDYNLKLEGACDTEALVRLIEQNYNGEDMINAIQQSTKQVRGSMAVAIATADGTLYLFRHRNPLNIAILDDLFIYASTHDAIEGALSKRLGQTEKIGDLKLDRKPPAMYHTLQNNTGLKVEVDDSGQLDITKFEIETKTYSYSGSSGSYYRTGGGYYTHGSKGTTHGGGQNKRLTSQSEKPKTLDDLDKSTKLNNIDDIRDFCKRAGIERTENMYAYIYIHFQTIADALDKLDTLQNVESGDDLILGYYSLVDNKLPKDSADAKAGIYSPYGRAWNF